MKTHFSLAPLHYMGPNLLKSWDNYELTGSGEFFKKAMHGRLE